MMSDYDDYYDEEAAEIILSEYEEWTCQDDRERARENQHFLENSWI